MAACNVLLFQHISGFRSISKSLNNLMAFPPGKSIDQVLPATLPIGAYSRRGIGGEVEELRLTIQLECAATCERLISPV